MHTAHHDNGHGTGGADARQDRINRLLEELARVARAHDGSEDSYGVFCTIAAALEDAFYRMPGALADALDDLGAFMETHTDFAG